jgi:hypothetical protein
MWCCIHCPSFAARYQLHTSLVDEFNYAMVWGRSVKHNPQRVGLSHVLEDEDVLQVTCHPTVAVEHHCYLRRDPRSPRHKVQHMLSFPPQVVKRTVLQQRQDSKYAERCQVS